MSAPRSAGLALGFALLLFTPGCARLFVRAPSTTTHAAAAMIAAGAARERLVPGLRLSLTVRATAGPPAARVTSPAYLAITDPAHLHLQVLSPFGVTVLDVTTDGDDFVVTEPMRNERREGRIDLAALADGSADEDDRMIVALAVLFRPKLSKTSGAGAERCGARGPAELACPLAAGLTAVVTFDDALRVVRETYLDPAGRPILVAAFDEYAMGEREGFPGRITITDGASDAALVIRVLRVQRAP